MTEDILLEISSAEGTVFESQADRKERLGNDAQLAKIKLLEQLLDLRKQYANRAFWLAIFWTIFVVFLTGLQFCKPYGMQINKAEFIAIVATALASIISLYLQVGKGIYIEKLEDL